MRVASWMSSASSPGRYPARRALKSRGSHNNPTTMRSVMENVYAIFAVDPGGSTGLAWGCFHKDDQSVQEAFKNKFAYGQFTIEDTDRNQVTEICRRWRALYKTWVEGLHIPPRDCYMVIEDFVLGPKTPSGKAPLRPINIGQGIYY